jgi:hypothetical protein
MIAPVGSDASSTVNVRGELSIARAAVSSASCVQRTHPHTCFLSWAFAQADMPLGEQAQGYGAVEQIHDWAARSGRLLPAGLQPQPGDIILYGGRHVGIIESVNADGSLTTVEGNHQNKVSRVHRSPSEATGFVRV